MTMTKKLMFAVLGASLLAAACGPAALPAEPTGEPGTVYTPAPTLTPAPTDDLQAQQGVRPIENGPVVDDRAGVETGDGDRTDLDAARVAPQPADANLTRDQVYLDVMEALTLESAPPQYRLRLAGSLPSPCHALRVVVNEPDAIGRIQVEAYSVADPNMVCTAVLQPFSVSIPIELPRDGTFEVRVNGQEIGELTR
jgi:hypothetical protein